MITTAAVLVVFVGALVLAIARRWEPASDWALIETQVADVGTSATPLVGSYSRFNWNHPGPALFYVLAVPYRLLGSWPNALLVGTAVVHGIAVVGIARSAWRLGRLPLVLISMLATALLAHSLGIEFLIDPWNPYAPLLVAGWYLFTVWEAGRGRRWAWPLALGIGSFAVQAHIGYAVLVVLPFVWALASALLTRPSPAAQPRWRLVLGATAIVVVVLWAAPVAQQLWGPGRGNLAALWSYGSSRLSDNAPSVAAGSASVSGSPTGVFAPRVVGLSRGLGLISLEVSGWAPWIGGSEPRQSNGGIAERSLLWLLVPLGSWAATAVSAWRARRRDVLQALGLAGTVLVAGWLSLAAVLGPVLTWIARPVWIVAWFFYLVLVWAVYEVIASGNVPAAARQWWRSHLDLTVGVVIVLIAALAVATVSTASNAAQPKEVFGRTTSELSTATLDWLARRSVRSVLVRPDGLGNGVHYPAIVAALRRAGYTVYLPEGFGDVLLPRHSISGHKADVALVVAAGDDHIVNWTGNAAVRQIAAISPASVAELTAGVVPVAVFAT